MTGAGIVGTVSRALWLADYLHELTLFPKSKDFDQIDSTSRALHVNDRTANARGWLDLVNEHLAAKALGRQLAIAQCQLGASCYHSRRCNKTDIHDSELSSGSMSLLSAGDARWPYR